MTTPCGQCACQTQHAAAPGTRSFLYTTNFRRFLSLSLAVYGPSAKGTRPIGETRAEISRRNETAELFRDDHRATRYCDEASKETNRLNKKKRPRTTKTAPLRSQRLLKARNTHHTHAQTRHITRAIKHDTRRIRVRCSQFAPPNAREDRTKRKVERP